MLRMVPGVGVVVVNGEIDFIVGRVGRNFIIERKSDPSVTHRPRGRLRPSQRRLRERWPGQYDVSDSNDPFGEILAITGMRPKEIEKWRTIVEVKKARRRNRDGKRSGRGSTTGVDRAGDSDGGGTGGGDGCSG